MVILSPLELQLEISRAFSPTAPIDEKSLFSGRIEQLTSLIRAIGQKGQHAVLFGERGVGKTSLANVLASFIGTSNTIIAPRINCDAGDTFDSVWRKVFSEIVIARDVLPVGFIGSTEREALPLDNLVPNQLSPESVRRTLSQFGGGSITVVIIDEFDRLTQEVKRQVADTIKTLSDHAVSATVVMVGVADSVQELIEEHQSVERAIVQIHMPRMAKKEISAIIEQGMGRLNFTVDTEAMDRIVTLSQGLPHYAHLLGLHAAEIMAQNNLTSVTLPVVDKAISNSLDNAQQSIKTAWHTATSSPRKDNLFSEVLMACALAKTDELGYFAAQDVREPLGQILGRQLEIANYAQHLSEFCGAKRGPVLQRIGGSRRYRFRFINPLLQPFVVMQGFSKNKIPH
ncbi:MAG: ATP-binding protein [Methylobacillus sp.]|nr:ATP-binding protein [Methylobacillus sp.]